MTKKIRLTNEEEVTVQNQEVTKTPAVIDTVTVKQLMKYLEAIDWKLWEMLKIMREEEEKDA